VAAVVRHVREHAADGLTVRDLLRQFPIVRRSMERRFRQSIGCIPHEQIRRVLVERAKQLLRETDLQMPGVARRSGFPNATRFGETLTRLVGQTPTAYRRHVAGEATERRDLE